MDCIFCKIVEGKIPCTKIYENENVLAFLDIAPINYGHTLIIPKKHYKNLEEIPGKELFEVIKVVKRIGAAVKMGLGAPGYNIGLNNDPVAGQVVPHLHFHVMPRNENDNFQLWQGGKYGDGEAEEAAKKIISKI